MNEQTSWLGKCENIHVAAFGYIQGDSQNFELIEQIETALSKA